MARCDSPVDPSMPEFDDDLQPIETDSRAAGRRLWPIYSLLIVCSLASMTGRLVQLEGESYGERVPFLSANDRSRWCTVRSLGDHDTYCIDPVLASENGFRWDTIDKVLHRGRDGKYHFYSSKPTLLPTLLTYPYLGLKHLVGWTFEEDPFKVVKTLLIIGQVIPLGVMFVLIGLMVNRIAISDWTRLYVMAAATLGTFLTTFAVSFNNHVPAAVCVSIALYAVLKIWRERQTNGWFFAAAGLFSGLAASFELPALAFLAVCIFLCFLRSIRQTIAGFVPAGALVFAAFFATNYVAHNEFRPPYAHRDDGAALATLAGEFESKLDEGEIPIEIKEVAIEHRAALGVDDASFDAVAMGGWDGGRRWRILDQVGVGRVIVRQPFEETDLPNFQIHARNNWYEYPGSYWLDGNTKRSTVDQGEAERWRYALHFTVGHHGIFSLTPIWLLSVLGLVLALVAGSYRMRMVALCGLAISVVVIGFYITRPPIDRNYGGLCSGPRWLFWMAPIWLISMIPALDWLDRRVGFRLIALILLFVSIFSALIPWSNPWVHPWIYQWFFVSN